MASTVSSLVIHAQQGSDSVYATWSWNHSKYPVDNYSVHWEYCTANGVWFQGTDDSPTAKQSVYSPPSNATRVRVKVKPIRKQVTKKKKKVRPSSSYSGFAYYTVTSITLEVPATPTNTLDHFKLTCSSTCDDYRVTQISFELLRGNAVQQTATGNIVNGTAIVIFTLAAGYKYTVRARSIYGSYRSDYSARSGEIQTVPTVPTGLTRDRAQDSGEDVTYLALKWNAVESATGYKLEYTNDKKYFDSGTGTQQATTDQTKIFIPGLTGGKWYFRIAATNSAGDSAWSTPVEFNYSVTPLIPTTWTTKSTHEKGTALRLYAVHNTTDEGVAYAVEWDYYINGSHYAVETYPPAPTDGSPQVCHFDVNIPTTATGDLVWKARTTGYDYDPPTVENWSPWSATKTVKLYSPTTCDLSLAQGEDVTEYPLDFTITTGPADLGTVSLILEVIPQESYEGYDGSGQVTTIPAGVPIYTEYFSMTASDWDDEVTRSLGPSDINLENAVPYKAVATCVKSSGLMATGEVEFEMSYEEGNYNLSALMEFDEDSMTMTISPICEDDESDELPDCLLSVYRINYDGSMTPIVKDVENTGNFMTVDPHPSLSTARYRLVAEMSDTGQIIVEDTDAYPIESCNIVIQWDEKVVPVDDAEDSMSHVMYAGNMIKMPYNIKTTENNTKDAELINYVGREQPVGYFGKAINDKSSMSCEILKEDTDTLDQLRLLSRWNDMVYIRELSGIGYWAQVSVSISRSYNSFTIPISLTVTRIDGGDKP